MKMRRKERRVQKLAVLLNLTATLSEKDSTLMSPNVRFEPGRIEIDKAIKILQRMEGNYFVGVSDVIATPGPEYGYVQSGPEDEHTKIHVNLDKVLSRSQGQAKGPQAIIATALVIAHERGHIKSFNKDQGFVGGEGPANAEEERVKRWIEQHINNIQDLLG